MNNLCVLKRLLRMHTRNFVHTLFISFYGLLQRNYALLVDYNESVSDGPVNGWTHPLIEKSRIT